MQRHEGEIQSTATGSESALEEATKSPSAVWKDSSESSG